MMQLVVFLDLQDIGPMRELQIALKLGHGQERARVLIVAFKRLV